MKHIYDLTDYITFLHGKISVSEKIDGSALILKVQNGKLNFYQRENSNEINYFIRTKNIIYEDVIQYLQSQDFSKYDNYEFYFEFFFKGIQPVIPIKKLPKHNLILNLVKHNGQTIFDKQTLFNISDALDINRPRILFQGYLNTYQQQELIKFIETKQLSISFVTWVTQLFNKHYELFGANNKTEGFVLTNLNTGEMVKLVDPKFTTIIKNKTKQREDNRAKEIITNIALQFKLDNPKPIEFNVGNSYSQKVVNLLIDNVLNKYKHLHISASDMKILQSYKLDNSNWFTLNKVLIQNKKLLHINQDWVILLLFTLLSFYMKERKRATKSIPKDKLVILNANINKLKQIYETNQFYNLRTILESIL